MPCLDQRNKFLLQGKFVLSEAGVSHEEGLWLTAPAGALSYNGGTHPNSGV